MLQIVEHSKSLGWRRNCLTGSPISGEVTARRSARPTCHRFCAALPGETLLNKRLENVQTLGLISVSLRMRR